MPGGAFRSAPGSLNCDDDVGGYGACFDRTADSPPIDLSPLAGVGATGATVASWCNYDLEEDDCLNDRRAVVISSDGFASALGQYCFKFADCGDPDTWHQHEVPLHWTWGTIQVRLLFDSLDGLACEACFDGWLVDGLAVTADCPPPVAYCTPAGGAHPEPGPGDHAVRRRHPLRRAPVVRTQAQLAGGNPPPPGCSGSHSYQFTPGYLAANPTNCATWLMDRAPVRLCAAVWGFRPHRNPRTQGRRSKPSCLI